MFKFSSNYLNSVHQSFVISFGIFSPSVFINIDHNVFDFIEKSSKLFFFGTFCRTTVVVIVGTFLVWSKNIMFSS